MGRASPPRGATPGTWTLSGTWTRRVLSPTAFALFPHPRRLPYRPDRGHEHASLRSGRVRTGISGQARTEVPSWFRFPTLIEALSGTTTLRTSRSSARPGRTPDDLARRLGSHARISRLFADERASGPPWRDRRFRSPLGRTSSSFTITCRRHRARPGSCPDAEAVVARLDDIAHKPRQTLRDANMCRGPSPGGRPVLANERTRKPSAVVLAFHPGRSLHPWLKQAYTG